MNRMISKCPVCAGPLHITELSCEACQTRVQSEFETCRFCRLTSDHRQFLEAFLRNRGNLSSVGEEIDISYPTVVKRLDAVLAALGLMEPEGAPSLPERRLTNREHDRRHILEMLDRGDITAEEATRRLRDL